MGNLFIGFPVPRAKIADMIESAAPPLEHVDNHLPDGSDPIILPGDISSGQLIKWNGSKFIGVDEPTGGIATRYADTDLYWYTNFESLDGFDTATSTGCSITLDGTMVWLRTQTIINRYARLRKKHDIQFPMGTWDNLRKFKVMAYLYTATNQYGLIYIGTGKDRAGRHVMFLVEDGVLKGSVHNGSSETKVELEDYGAGTYAKTKPLEAIFTPASKAEFYVSGLKLGEITTGLPSGPTDAEYWLYAYIRNTDGSNTLWLWLSQF